MLFYFIKSGACLAILLVFYTFFLEKEGIHTFKRYYLLTAVIISFVIPLITFTQYIEVSEGATPVFTDAMSFDEDTSTLSTVNYWPVVLWSIYGIGVLFFYLRFLVRIKGIINRIKQNPVKQYAIYTNVLHNDKLAPHTFLKYIFLNEDDYHQNNIPDEVLLHEKAHARQQHSLDIIFLEVLQIICWFNPLIYWAKRHIKLNHEFLADREVLKQGVHSSLYQETILAFSSHAKHSNLASAINYSSIKKRFTVMKTQTSRFTRLKSALLLPLLAVLVYSFSEKEIVENTNEKVWDTSAPETDSVTQNPDRNDIDTYYEHATFKFKQTDGSYLTKKYSELTSEEKRMLLPPPTIPQKKVPSSTQLNNWKKSKEYGVWLDNKKIENTKLNNLTTNDIHHYVTSKLMKNAKDYGKYTFDLSIYTNTYFNAKYKSAEYPKPLTSNTVIYVDPINKVIRISQEQATEKMIKEYNKFADKYKQANSGKVRIDKKEVTRMHYIYGLMTKEQKAKAQPYPSFPPPPDSSQEASYSKARSKFLAYVTPKGAWPQVYLSLSEPETETIKKLYRNMVNAYYKLSSDERNSSEKMPPPPPARTTKQKKIKEKVHETPELSTSPKRPKSAYEYVKSLKNDDITYNYNKKQLSYDEILKIVKEEPHINILTNVKDSKGTVHFWSVEDK